MRKRNPKTKNVLNRVLQKNRKLEQGRTEGNWRGGGETKTFPSEKHEKNFQVFLLVSVGKTGKNITESLRFSN